MSWDVMLFKTKTNSEPMNIIEDEDMLTIDKEEVISELKRKFPNIEQTGPNFLTYEGGPYAITFHLADSSIMLYIHILDEPEDAVMPVIKELCTIFHSRAWDTTSGEFL